MWGFSDSSWENFRDAQEEKEKLEIINTYESNLKKNGAYTIYLRDKKDFLKNYDLIRKISFFSNSKRRLSYIVCKTKWYDIQRNVFLEHKNTSQKLIECYEISIKNEDKTLSVCCLISKNGDLIFQFINGDWVEKFKKYIDKAIQKEKLKQKENDPILVRLKLEDDLKKSDLNLKKYIKPK